ncbi:MAG TPA: hypothetical protein VMM17_05005 [Gemmatimonadaceae bacterium]|nr:hypothetical protein [Gemmatimonadaceae bacterium]
MRKLAVLLLAAVALAACERNESAALTDTLAMPPVDGGIPLVAPGSAPAVVERAQSPLDLDVGGIDTTRHVDTPAPRPPLESAGPDSIIGRDSAEVGPLLPVPPDTGHEH